MKRLLQLPSSRSLPPGSGFLPLGPRSLPLGLGPASGHGSMPPSLDLPPSSRPSDFSFLTINGNLPFIRLIPAITTMKMTSYALCSTPTTPHTSPGHDLQLTDRDTPCSSKHIKAPCSLKHIDYSTICFGHVPHRTDDSYHLQGRMPIQATFQVPTWNPSSTAFGSAGSSLWFLPTPSPSLESPFNNILFPPAPSLNLKDSLYIPWIQLVPGLNYMSHLYKSRIKYSQPGAVIRNIKISG
ncbi:hypothetical protein DY000_02020547 [Brassica cretica]|uniref:Uncharacterized protein n=1 Tax=Brassica cretica TaxID=69181 RepID=A0ABQ7EKB0_BRACR|nr:hypothetical protein DY000_02020547 [Brassica cretica]